MSVFVADLGGDLDFEHKVTLPLELSPRCAGVSSPPSPLVLGQIPKTEIRRTGSNSNSDLTTNTVRARG